MVGEWLPQTTSFSIDVDRLAGLGGELRQRAVVVEPQHRGEVAASAATAPIFIAM